MLVPGPAAGCTSCLAGNTTIGSQAPCTTAYVQAIAAAADSVATGCKGEPECMASSRPISESPAT